MSFVIQIEQEVYTLENFIGAHFDEFYLKPIQLFLDNWVHDRIFIFKSSGSTGIPKEFSFSKHALELSAQATIDALNLGREQEHILMCLDANFVGGAMMLARAIKLDCPLTIMKPSSNVFDKISSSHSFTFASFVPLQLMDEGFSAEKYNRFKNVLIGGSSLSSNLKERIRELSANSFQSYGMTETLSHVALKNIKVSDGYKAIAPYSIRINDSMQICIKAPFLNEELLTNDLAKWVSKDHFEWLGRLDFVINSGGVKISPEEIEKAIIEIGILPINCQIVLSSLAHEKWGSELVLVVSKPISQKVFEEIKFGLIQRGLKYKVPKRFFYLSPFPLLDSGKVSRRKINEWLVNQ
jgi:O-succinylbenzoic acid--CoA ligase